MQIAYTTYFREFTYETDFTPYMHVFIFHTGYFLTKYGSLKPFSMESVELMNRKNKMVFFSGTDHGREDGISEQVSLQISKDLLNISLENANHKDPLRLKRKREPIQKDQ